MNTINERRFIIVTWPECQELMDKIGFQENSCLIDSYPFIEEYGSSAFFVDEEWYIRNVDYVDEHTVEQLLANEVRIKASLDIARKEAKKASLDNKQS